MLQFHLRLARMHSSAAGPFRKGIACFRMRIPHKKPEQIAPRCHVLAVEIVTQKMYLYSIDQLRTAK